MNQIFGITNGINDLCSDKYWTQVLNESEDSITTSTSNPKVGILWVKREVGEDDSEIPLSSIIELSP